jgi:aminopeptidase-like protein
MDQRVTQPWQADESRVGQVIYDLAAELFPICRSITGAGVRETLAVLGRHIPLTVHEVPSGTRVFDWTVPREWNIREAHIKDAQGSRVVDFRDSNLHVVSYSTPVRTVLPLAELKKHIFTIPDQPDLIPYRTSYYAESWGFCMAHNALLALPDGDYEVVIDSTLEPGNLTYGEFLHRGESEDEVLLAAHICHPSLANDNCSGLALLTHLAREISVRKTRLSYRFIFAPGTIGPITWLARNEASAHRIKHGMAVSCVGDGGGPFYKRSRRGDAAIDRAAAHVLKHAAPGAVIRDYFPYGYDERQYCSPGFDLPVGLFQRSQFGTFPEYHTSADNLDFIRPEHLGTSHRIVSAMLDVIENDRRLYSLNPKCEPQLGRWGLYGSKGGEKGIPDQSMAILWVLAYSDGKHSLLDIAEKADMPFANICETARLLEERGLVSEDMLAGWPNVAPRQT